jgi:hypothetical protein
MEISKALETIKAVCDDAVKNGRFRTIDETAAVTEAYNTLVMVSNAVVQSNQPSENQEVAEQSQEPHLEQGGDIDGSAVAEDVVVTEEA